MSHEGKYLKCQDFFKPLRDVQMQVHEPML